MYSMRLCLKSFFALFLVSCQSADPETTANVQSSDSIRAKDTYTNEIIVGAEKVGELIELIEDKRVGVVANQTSVINNTHLVDSLLSLDIDLKTVFSPEHGFRGRGDAGERIKSMIDESTGLPIISLYGENKKPSAENLKGIEVMIFDIQDVGARFYTYISTLHYVMEACAEQNIPLIILDRPNPHGQGVDGPVRKKGFESFVGMHPVPIIHGMTIGEYGQMINGEKWLQNGVQCALTVISCDNYTHDSTYSLPIPPSPNLRSDAAIALYPSLCLFEGTVISVGRGTENPFEVIGHPLLESNRLNYPHEFTPVASFGAQNPKLMGKVCYGLDLRTVGLEMGYGHIQLDWLINTYQELKGNDFFIVKNGWFDKLAGTDELRKQIIAGKTEQEIKESWQPELESFKLIREKYLLYAE